MNQTLGMPLSSIKQPNKIIDANGFYVSYNSIDARLYGGDTTALVDEQTQKFYILNGDHRKSYAGLLSKGFSVCLDYFKSNINQKNKHSDKA